MKKTSRMLYVSQAIIGMAGFATIAYAMYLTNKLSPLLAIILVYFAIPRESKEEDK